MLKIWKRMPISRKIFIGALTVLITLFVLMLLGQLFFFHRYYTYLITRRLVNTVESFSQEYLDWESNDEINSGIVNYSNDGNVYIMVMGENGDLLHMVSYEMLIRTETGEEARVTLDDAVRSSQFQKMSLEKGDFVAVEYRAPKDAEQSGIYVPDRIYSNDGMWAASPRPDNWEEAGDFVSGTISGEIMSVILPSEQSAGTIIQRREAFSAAMDWRFRARNFLDQEESFHYIYRDDETGNLYTVAASPVSKDGSREVVLAIAPMRQVYDAVEVSKRLSTIWLVVAVFAAGIFAFVFTGIISKPILNMSSVTKKMRNLDFSEKCKVSGDDEIGMLAQNINDMSDKLDETINKLKRANDKLTADIEHERMLENQRKEFVAAVSHELKTPLAVIQAYAEGILDGISGENREKYLHVILEETKRMDKLVYDMLENSRLEAGAERLELKEHDLNSLAQKAGERFEKRLLGTGISFVLELSDEPEIYSFDLNRIDQVTENFLTNALFHTKPGGRIILKVSGGELSCENTGEPIKDTDKAYIWDKFYKADKSRTRSGRGTGLGLSIAKNILNLHHAEYGVENTTEGVRFWYRLKRQDS